MLADSILADFMSGLDPNISMLLYRLNYFNKIMRKDLADREVKEKAETLTGTDQRMVS